MDDRTQPHFGGEMDLQEPHFGQRNVTETTSEQSVKTFRPSKTF